MFSIKPRTEKSRPVVWPVVCLISVACGCSARPAEPANLPAAAADTSAEGTTKNAKPAGRESHTVELVIDYGDGVQKRFAEIGWTKSMTVLDVLKAGQEHSHGISFSARGSGETAMVTAIDGLTNQGGAANDKNWIFRINGRMGDESCGIAEVRPGDTVLWKFGPYE